MMVPPSAASLKSQPVAAHSQLALEYARRLDWRFLLPDPMLSNAAYLGSADSPLVHALRTLFPSVMDARTSPHRQFATVVVGGASVRVLAAAAGFIEPHGWLYAEFTRTLHSPAAWLQTVRRCRRELCRLGFDQVFAFWHRPNFTNCLEIIPLSEPAARAFALSRCSPDWRSRAKFALAHLLDRTGMLALAAPCFSVVAHKIR